MEENRLIKMFEMPNVNRQALFTAIGYLSTWCMNTYNHVNIYTDRSCGPGSIVGWFYNENEEKIRGPNQYVMGAVYNTETETYSYHS